MFSCWVTEAIQRGFVILMRIFIHPSSSHCLNLGDVAMMQVTCRRFRKFWPDAEIHVLNDAPELLELYCPGAKPMRPIGQQSYYATAAYLTRMGKRFAMPALSELDVAWRHRWPGLAEQLVAARSGTDTAAEMRKLSRTGAKLRPGRRQWGGPDYDQFWRCSHAVAQHHRNGTTARHH